MLNKSKKLSVFSKSSLTMCECKKFCKEDTINLTKDVGVNEICYVDKKSFE